MVLRSPSLSQRRPLPIASQQASLHGQSTWRLECLIVNGTASLSCFAVGFLPSCAIIFSRIRGVGREPVDVACAADLSHKNRRGKQVIGKGKKAIPLCDLPRKCPWPLAEGKWRESRALENNAGAGRGIRKLRRKSAEGHERLTLMTPSSLCVLPPNTARTAWSWLGHKGLFPTLGHSQSKGLRDTGFSPVILTQVMPVTRSHSPLLACPPLLSIPQSSRLAPLRPLERVRQLLQLFL